MYRKDLDSLLKKSSPRVALLYGESDFLIGYYSLKIAKQITEASNKTTFYYSDYDFRAVMDILGQSSLFGDESLVVLKLDKKLPKKEIDSLLNAISNNANNSLIIEFYRSDSKSNAEYSQDFRTFSSAFKGDGVIDVRFFAPNFYESLALLRERANELNLKIEDRLLGVILDLQNNDLGIAHNELEKFTIFDAPISIDDIHRLCYGLGSVSIDELYNAIFDKKDAWDILQKIQEEGLDDMEILRDMERYFYQLFLFFAYIKSNGSPNAKEILGFAPPQMIVDKIAARSIRIKEEGYQGIFEIFRKWRNVSMRGEKNFSLSVLIKLQAYIR